MKNKINYPNLEKRYENCCLYNDGQTQVAPKGQFKAGEKFVLSAKISLI